MKIYAILFVLLPTWETFAQNYYNQNTGNAQQNEESLTDIRWVSLKKVQPQQHSTKDLPPRKEKNPVPSFDAATAQKVNADIYSAQQQQSILQQQQQKQHQQQYMMFDQKQSQQVPQQLEQHQQQQLQHATQANREYIQKMANQLFLTQKHAPLLSEYQKFIINQDPLVRKYVFGTQEKSQQQGTESSQSVSSQYKARSLQLHQQAGKTKINGKSDNSKYAHGNDATAQSSKLMYTSEPPSFFDYKVVPNLTPKVALYRTVQPYAYYNLGGSSGLPLQTIQSFPLKAAGSPIVHFGFDSYKTYPFHHDIKTFKHVEGHHEHIGDNYEFVYDVKDDAKGNNFGHKETRDNDKTYGHYYLQLPDGRFETVKYWADKSGFHANVEFKGRAAHPEPHHHHLHHHPHYL